METQNEKPIEAMRDLLYALNDFIKRHPVMNCFYSVELHCGNEIRMQGYLDDILFDYLLLNDFEIEEQRLMKDGSTSIHMKQPFYSIYGKYDVVIVLIDRKK